MSTPETARNAWRILLITLVASVLSNMDQSLFGYAVPGIMADLGLSLNGIGLIISLSFGTAIAYTLVVGSITRALGPRLMLALSLAVSALFVGLQALATSVVAFGIARALGFALSAAITSVSGAYVATSTPPRWRALAIAFQNCGYPFGWYVSSLVAAHMMTGTQWRSSFMVAFAVIPLAAVIYWLLPRSQPAPVVTTPEGAASEAELAGRSLLGALLSPEFRRPAIVFGLAFFLYGGAQGGVVFYLPTFFQQARGYDPVTATEVVGLAYAVGMIGYIAAAVVSEYWLSRRTTTIIWLWAGAVGLLATIWLPRSALEDKLFFGATTIFFNGSSSILFTALLESFPPWLRTSAAAVSGSACLCLGFVVYPVVVSHTVGHVGWLWAFTVVIVPSVIAAGALILSLRRGAHVETAVSQAGAA
jgi:MFS transporter, putative metabolite:H+ symporter